MNLRGRIVRGSIPVTESRSAAETDCLNREKKLTEVPLHR